MIIVTILDEDMLIFNVISSVNAQGSVKIRLACLKGLLLNISSSNIVTHFHGYINGLSMTNISFFIKKYSPETKLFTKQSNTIQKDYIYHTIKHFIERYLQDFQKFMVSIHFFHKMTTLM